MVLKPSQHNSSVPLAPFRLFTHKVVPTPFQSPLVPVSLRTVASSLQNPPIATPPAASIGMTNEAPPPPPPIRVIALSSAMVSPQIPAHFDGCKHPEGGAIGEALERNDENDNSAAAGLSVAVPDEADDTHVKGFVPPVLVGKRARGDVNTDVWQHSVGGGTGCTADAPPCLG